MRPVIEHIPGHSQREDGLSPPAHVDPIGQMSPVGEVEPTVQAKPGGAVHGMQVELLVAPSTELYFPAWHNDCQPLPLGQ